jgi:siroheme synthase
LTHRGIASGFAVVTGHCLGEDRVDWAALARIETLVVLMGAARLAEIAALLLRHGRPAGDPVAVIERATLPGSRVWTGTLRELADGEILEIGSPATLVVGEVVRVRESLFGDLEDREYDLRPPIAGRAL